MSKSADPIIEIINVNNVAQSQMEYAAYIVALLIVLVVGMVFLWGWGNPVLKIRDIEKGRTMINARSNQVK